MRPDFSHGAATIRDRKRSWFCQWCLLLLIRANSDNFDDDRLSSKFGGFEFESEKRRNRISNTRRRDSASTNLREDLFDGIRMGNY